MIYILIEESEAFDRLSILEIKRDFLETVSKGGMILNSILNQIIELRNNTASSIGIRKVEKICKSTEYKKLKEINKKLFDGFNLLKNTTEPIDARELDDLNYVRHLAKNNLQQKFFNQGTREVKLGYE